MTLSIRARSTVHLATYSYVPRSPRLPWSKGLNQLARMPNSTYSQRIGIRSTLNGCLQLLGRGQSRSDSFRNLQIHRAGRYTRRLSPIGGLQTIAVTTFT